MKLRNKKTGEIRNVELFGDNFLIEAKDYPSDTTIVINSLAQLNEEWEDYEEPKDYWCIDTCEGWEICRTKEGFGLADKEDKEIGNYFETKEEAEKAVEKLKAWERLKEKGFRFIPEFHRIEEGDERGNIMFIACTMNDDKDFIYGDNKDLKLLFGGEE